MLLALSLLISKSVHSHLGRDSERGHGGDCCEMFKRYGEMCGAHSKCGHVSLRDSHEG